MDSKPICHPSPANKMKCFIFGLCSLLMISQAGWWTRTPSATPLQPKKWNAHFWITFNFWMISQAGQWTQTPSTTPLQPKKWNAHFWITFNFWWLAGLVNGLKPHLPALSSQKNEMLLFGLRSTSDDQLGLSMDLNPIHHLSPAKKWNAHILIMFTSDDWPGWSMDLNPIHHPSPAKKMKSSFLYYVQLLMLARLVNGLEKKWNACFWIMFTWWSAWLIDGLKPHLPPLSYQKNEMLNFWLHSTSDDQPGW